MGEVSITRAVELDAAVGEVWEAVTTPELLSGWLDGDVDLDVRPGGTGTILEPGGAVRRMRVDEVDPARRLALRWWPEDGSGPASTVELDLQPLPGGTRLVVTETLLVPRPLSARASVAAASAGWDLRLLLLGWRLLREPAGRR
jgi:uncharacterized protein YndB with AHSA1/START domain